jgi:hypothetical protein
MLIFYGRRARRILPPLYLYLLLLLAPSLSWPSASWSPAGWPPSPSPTTSTISPAHSGIRLSFPICGRRRWRSNSIWSCRCSWCCCAATRRRCLLSFAWSCRSCGCSSPSLPATTASAGRFCRTVPVRWCRQLRQLCRGLHASRCLCGRRLAAAPFPPSAALQHGWGDLGAAAHHDAAGVRDHRLGLRRVIRPLLRSARRLPVRLGLLRWSPCSAGCWWIQFSALPATSPLARRLAALGAHSYEFYILHYPVLGVYALFAPFDTPATQLVAAGVCLPASAGLAVLLHRTSARPVTRLPERSPRPA